MSYIFTLLLLLLMSREVVFADERNFATNVNGYLSLEETDRSSLIENWDKAKQKSKSGEWQNWTASVRKTVDDWILLNNERFDQPVGWAHDYVRSPSGSFDKWNPHLSYPSNSGLKYQLAFLYYVRSYNIGIILDAVRLYKLTGEVKYKAWAVNQISSYALSYSKLPLQNWNGKSRLFNQALDEAVKSFILLEACRLLKDELSDSTKSLWESSLFLPIANNLMTSLIPDNNMAVWISSAVSSIGIEFNKLDLIDYGINSQQGLINQLKNNVSADGFWIEMSLSYQEYVVEALSQFIYASRIRHYQNSNTEYIASKALLLLLSPLQLRFNDGLSPIINDGIGNKKIPNPDFWNKYWRLFPTYQGWGSEGGKSWDLLLDDTPIDVKKSSFPTVETSVLKGLDSAQLVGNDWHALIRFGQRVVSHSHQDSLTYDLQFANVWVFRDAGTVGYGSELHKNYFRKGQASNAPLVNYVGQMPWPSEGGVKEILPAENKLSVVHDGYQKNVVVERQLAAGEREFTDTLDFRSKVAGQVISAGGVFNTDCLVSTDLPVVSTEPIHHETFKYWKDWKQFSLSNDGILMLDCGDQKFKLLFQSYQAYKLYLAKSPSVTGATRNAIFIELKPAERASLNLRVRITK